MTSHTEAVSCSCAHCPTQVPFELPERLIEAFIAGNVVIFAGAGMSTETRRVLPTTFYEEILSGITAENATGFAEVMTSFCATRGRSELLLRLRRRFDLIDSFPELWGPATSFHRELSTVHLVQDIVTTNWDSYFERHCGALPIVTDLDFAFWSFPVRKVYKIHGSINNVGTIVATEEDYRKCYRRLRDGVLGASLKLMLATKTLVFVGYSLRDDDFNRIYNYLERDMGELLPRSYLVTLSDRPRDNGFQQLTTIQTDGTFFITCVKKRLVELGIMLPDRLLDEVDESHGTIRDQHRHMHEEFPLATYPDLIYAASYQDGLMHALQRMVTRCSTGYYSHRCNIEAVMREYKVLYEQALSAENYWDAAYLRGYAVGLSFLLVGDEQRKQLPVYFVFGSDKELVTVEDFRRELDRAASLHTQAHEEALRLVQGAESGTELYHPPHFGPWA